MFRGIRDDHGQALAEYVIVLGFIAALCVVALPAIANALMPFFLNAAAGI